MLIFCYCCNNLPQIWWLMWCRYVLLQIGKTEVHYKFHRAKVKCKQKCFFLEDGGKNPFLAPPSFWRLGSFGCITPITASMSMPPSPCRILGITLANPDNPRQPPHQNFLNIISSVKYFFPLKVTHSLVSGFVYEDLLGGDGWGVVIIILLPTENKHKTAIFNSSLQGKLIKPGIQLIKERTESPSVDWWGKNTTSDAKGRDKKLSAIF